MITTILILVSLLYAGKAIESYLAITNSLVKWPTVRQVKEEHGITLACVHGFLIFLAVIVIIALGPLFISMVKGMNMANKIEEDEKSYFKEMEEANEHISKMSEELNTIVDNLKKSKREDTNNSNADANNNVS